MPNDCCNHITITCENREFIQEFHDLILNELKCEENGENVYRKTINILQEGTRGIIFNLWSPWHPDFDWLNSLLDKYPNCWIKNEWSEEGGLAGVWVGCVKNNEKEIKQLTWDDICLEGKHYLFMNENS